MAKSKSNKVASKKTSEAKPKEVNPFERKVNKPKFDIYGRKLKGTETNLGQSRARAIETRKQSLLVEYQQSGKVNTFVDNRIGEDDPTLSQEEKALIRFQKEATKRYGGSKKSIFNLEDDEELTHLGTSLGDMENFDDYVPSDGEDENLTASMVSAVNFGGFKKVDESSEEHQKTREQVLAEIIAKSKAMKHEKAKEKMEQEQLMNQLDSDFRDIRSLMSIRKPEDKQATEKDEFDITVRELAFEVRARPTDRLKTPEELAKEEKEKLEILEKERIRRMRGEESDDDTQNNENGGRRGNKKRKQQDASADALDDDFILDMANDPSQVGIGEESSEEEDEENSVDGEEDGENSEENSEEEEEEDMEDLEEDEENSMENSDEEESEVVKKPTKKSKRKVVDFSGGIPYTFNVPESQEEFREWLDGRTNDEKSLIIQRIRACNHISLAPDNKQKLQQFFGILMEHFLYLCSTTAVSGATIPFEEMDLISKIIFEMSSSMQNTVGIIARETIASFQSSLAKRIEEKSGSVWPSIGHLMYFKLISNIFPASDFQHGVVTPAMLLMSQYLSQGSIRNGKEYTLGLFLGNLLLHYVESTKRYCPEVLKFLREALLSCISVQNKKPTLNQAFVGIPAGFLNVHDKKNSKKIQIGPMDVQMLAGLYKDKKELFTSDSWRVNALYGTIQLVHKYAKLWFSQPAFPEIFLPIQEILKKIPLSHLPETVQKAAQELGNYIEISSDKRMRNRKPLQLQLTKPKQLKLLNPRFQEKYSIKKDYDVDTERANLKKLRNKATKEKRGAIRELRKDNWFLNNEKTKKQRIEVEERDAKGRKIMAMLEQQQAEIKDLDRKKNNPRHKSAF